MEENKLNTAKIIQDENNDIVNTIKTIVNDIYNELKKCSHNFYMDLDETVLYIEKRFLCEIKTIYLDIDSFSEEVSEESLFGADGFIFSNHSNQDKKIYFIGINDKNPKPLFDRFTLAHELGHICLGHHDFPGFKVSMLKSFEINFNDVLVDKETQASVFALALLIPLDLLNIFRCKMDMNELAEVFKVDRTLIEKRLELFEGLGI